MANTVHLSVCLFLMVTVLPLRISASPVELEMSGISVNDRPIDADTPSIRLDLLILREKCRRYQETGVNPLPSFCHVDLNQQRRVPTYADLRRMYDSYLREEAADFRMSDNYLREEAA